MNKYTVTLASYKSVDIDGDYFNITPDGILYIGRNPELDFASIAAFAAGKWASITKVIAVD